ncbi:hypothetical protein E3N88_06540 [Mikania micrantha]|uniref:Uncharacterized protein n=1 Tax=Mikania micrantha TaxID=192012 RepID=A0A5N6PNZ2_9ASTR|nr:hypothetical protein E3N88_06540 [Mikania micrantha]
MVGSSNKTQFPSSSSSVPTKPPKGKFIFTSYFFSKSLIIILVLLVFSYFPSQVPEIFKETTIVNKLWDLIYLLVIGIAVCYGLFSRKIDGVHSSDESDGNIGEKETYLSGISHISAIFEDGIQNSYGFEENSLFGESRFSGIGDGFGKSDGEKLNQCFLGESMVVINDENYVLEQLGRQKTIKQNKPLCLPVRNLGSKSLDSAACKSVVEDSSSGWDEYQKAKFRGLVPIKLEEKFKENDSDSASDSDSRTRLNWRSKSMRLEKREDMFTIDANETSHFRPHSVGVLDFDDLKSQPKRSEMPSKIKNLSEKQDSKGIELNHRNRKPFLDGETSFMESKPQESINGGVSEMTNRLSETETQKDFNGKLGGSFEEILKDFGNNTVDDGTIGSKHSSMFVKSKSQSSSSDASSERNMETLKNMLRKEAKESANIANTYKRGKSVRTNRSKEHLLEPKVKMNQIQTDDDTVELRSTLGIDEMNVKAEELSDTEPHSGEVDRKAEEFIAKFREQIRLQKVASARKLNLL